jgi:hypothetical protein
MIATAYLVIDMLAWIFTGFSFLELISGDRSPVMIEIANQVRALPLWGFWLLCLVSVALVSSMSALILAAMYKEEFRS